VGGLRIRFSVVVAVELLAYPRLGFFDPFGSAAGLPSFFGSVVSLGYGNAAAHHHGVSFLCVTCLCMDGRSYPKVGPRQAFESGQDQ
jgi:hypothetical protein